MYLRSTYYVIFIMGFPFMFSYDHVRVEYLRSYDSTTPSSVVVVPCVLFNGSFLFFIYLYDTFVYNIYRFYRLNYVFMHQKRGGDQNKNKKAGVHTA